MEVFYRHVDWSLLIGFRQPPTEETWEKFHKNVILTPSSSSECGHQNGVEHELL